jgi:predicted hotdog family 3-hydroxylacyl-ACP dehydratase
MMAGSLPPLAKLVPHTGQAVLLDEVLEETAQGITAAVRIVRSHPFYSEALGGVPTWVGIELMAQAIAAHAGLIGLREHKQPRAGYLLGTRRYRPTVPAFPEGMRLTIRVKRLYLEDSGLAAYDCSIQDGDTLLIQATLTVYQTEDEIRR